jgi:pyridoxamine 5'-phosphate oxidase family protein
MSFNEEEKAYLRSRRLARIATVADDGQPDVVPVGFEFDADRFYIAGLDLPSTRKYRNVAAGNDRVALVVDDIATETPWSPRSVRVYGTARIVERDTDSGRREYLEVEPTVSWSWNLEGRPLDSGDAMRSHKVVHRSTTDPS